MNNSGQFLFEFQLAMMSAQTYQGYSSFSPQSKWITDNPSYMTPTYSDSSVKLPLVVGCLSIFGLAGVVFLSWLQNSTRESVCSRFCSANSGRTFYHDDSMDDLMPNLQRLIHNERRGFGGDLVIGLLGLLVLGTLKSNIFCPLACSTNGGFSEYTNESCSVTCGLGTLTQIRDCTNPRPTYFGLDCQGARTRVIPCNAGTCEFVVSTCEGQLFDFTCPEGTLISISDINFGRLDASTCSAFATGPLDVANTNCRLNVTNIFDPRCSGQKQCRILVSNNLFPNDPCPGTLKYTTSTFRCI